MDRHHVFVAKDTARICFIEENESTESGLIHSAPFEITSLYKFPIAIKAF